MVVVVSEVVGFQIKVKFQRRGQVLCVCVVCVCVCVCHARARLCVYFGVGGVCVCVCVFWKDGGIYLTAFSFTCQGFYVDTFSYCLRPCTTVRGKLFVFPCVPFSFLVYFCEQT